MPDHVHLLHARSVRVGFGVALQGYAQWRNAQRGTSGAVWDRQGSTEEVPRGLKTRRLVRYIHLNPCRARLVDDPLAWAWSTHRDQVGLAVPTMRAVASDPIGFHRYVSSDPTVRVDGTPLPMPTDLLPAGPAAYQAIRHAVGESLRTPASLLRRRGPPRTLLLRSLVQLTGGPLAEIADFAGVHRRTVDRVEDRWDETARVVSRLVDDPRFPGLVEWDLPHLPSWSRYRGRP